MSKYEPEVLFYYGTSLEDKNKLVPAPNITISLEYNYSNDSIIGYSYIVNLTGSITALDLRNKQNQEIRDPSKYFIGAVIDHADKLRDILSQNGSTLYITKSNNIPIIKAKGGILRSFNIDDSPNNWMHYVNYTASIEFHSIDFDSYIDNPFIDTNTVNLNSIIDINKYKIKSFNDSWSLTFDENDSFNKIYTNDVNQNLHIANNSFNIQYTVSAVGKHFFVDGVGDAQDERYLLPAWEQAKNFVQDRLYEQVMALISGILQSTNNQQCNGDKTLADLSAIGGASGLYKDFHLDYNIYNEKITCDSSESEGSFSATYSAIVKTNKGNTTWSSPNTKHTIQKTVNTTAPKGIDITSISVNGTIQGLLEGGLIRTPKPIQLPSQGSFFISQNTTNNMYNNAKAVLDLIYDKNAYSNGIGNSGKRDLKKSFKDILGITMAALGLNTNPNDPIPDPPHPISFNLTHDYLNGNISYNIEYNSERCSGRKIHDITITTNMPNKVVATFTIPNSASCPLVQELGTQTAKVISVSIKGIDFSNDGQPSSLDLVTEITKELVACDINGYLPVGVAPGGSIITQQQYTKNPVDGSFSVDISYICNDYCLI